MAINKSEKGEVVVHMERITYAILFIRGQKVMLDSDLAELYGVATKVLIQAVKRNADRFPEDFMFQLSDEEFEHYMHQNDPPKFEVTICDLKPERQSHAPKPRRPTLPTLRFY